MQSGMLLDERSPEREGSSHLRRAASISARVAFHANATPDAVAILDGSTRLTYADLERRSNQLAAHLQEAGAGPECCIGVFLERSAQFVVSTLSVLKAGAAYLPIDSSTPPERVAFILTDAQAPLLLTHRGHATRLPAGPWRVIDLDADAPGIAARTMLSPSIEPAPEDLAYVIYTSGSTGTPKGVEITHANLLNLVDWHQHAFGVSAADRASQVASFGFDAAGWEIWPYLTSGASLHMADEATRRSPQGLRDWLLSEKITISFVPTILSEQLLQASWPADTALRFLLTGADTLRRRPPSGVPFVLVNNYGPTECTVVATSGTVAAEGQIDGPPSIGRPIANTTALILDDMLRPVAAGEVGELCLAGTLVGRGYRNSPEMTASRFVTVSPTSGPPLRIYRTGDRARLLPDGEIAFLGRVDDQVKIRGYRIELGEIVACLGRCAGIEGCAVTTRDTPEGPVLVAYVMPAREARLTVADLREFLAA
ncbi:MAG: amino acid adenylation domain-containing protein, partial [Vicinamibacterales bacterium]